MSQTCVSLTAKDIKQMVRAARASRDQGAEIVELRLDHLANCDSETLAELREKIDFIPVIATLRPGREGGFFRWSERFRIELLEKAIECGFDYVDLELGIGKGRLERLLGLCRRRGVKSIVSHHDLARTPGVEQMLQRIEECAAAGDIGKVAFMARSPQDTLRVIAAARFARERKIQKFIAIGMGEHGKITRILGPLLGSAIVYASLDEGKKTAEGQLDIESLKRIWGAPGVGKNVTPSTALYGLIGRPLGHSLSPLMHNAAFKSLGIDAVYLPFEVEQNALKGTILALKAFGLHGANVTIPYKEKVMPYLDCLDVAARDIGAVNTILNKNGKLTGYNTDARGFIDALKCAGVRLDSANALVIGAGGAAKAAVWGLLKENAKVTVANRTRKRGLGLKRLLGPSEIDVVDLESIERSLKDADIVVNCTPVGMNGFASKSPVPGGLLRRGMAVFDMVYNPIRTPLLGRAEKKGAKTISGMEMFIRQGMESFRIWTGKCFDMVTIRRALIESQLYKN